MGAKYAAWKKFGDKAEYIGVNYGKPLPRIENGSDVYIIDFSYPKEILRELNGRSSKLLVLDHHKTAQEDLAGEPYAIFDMDRSGAVLAWNYFFPDSTVPTLLEMIQDMDLWKWKIPGTRNIMNFLEILGDDVSTWDQLVPLRGGVYSKGGYISQYQDRLLEKQVHKDNIAFRNIGKHKVGILNTSVYPSEIGSWICINCNVDYSMTWNMDSTNVVRLSFRSVGDFDVSEIAKLYGGGGHRNASGARTTPDKLMGILSGQP
jgi:oligoribonuclease NrnB/cAMP/cGMP phosphodiesterase (DHH superfamily)